MLETTASTQMLVNHRIIDMQLTTEYIVRLLCRQGEHSGLDNEAGTCACISRSSSVVATTREQAPSKSIDEWTPALCSIRSNGLTCPYIIAVHVIHRAPNRQCCWLLSTLA